MLSAEQKDWFHAVQKHASENYEKGGWDYFVECWDENEFEEFLTENDIGSLHDAIVGLAEQLGVLSSVRSDVIGAGGGCTECLAFEKCSPTCTKQTLKGD